MLEPIRDKRCAGNRPVQGHIPPGFVFQIAAADIGVHAQETYLLEIQAAVDVAFAVCGQFTNSTLPVQGEAMP
ncbi:hypothetical protein [Bradyrhizobium sp. CB2312]|uniref:hypothetical protein n=1 Tax=Bradyrhizobium sp. CB2312 TaxID=3039155 RepID=UPI0024B0F412|nr:hypothetical protein [Bradyrhizobium sp. CB2312]WFU71453.1 hypothetical protein QA642_40810 [Bradyrhizobium sp. CB2312]